MTTSTKRSTPRFFCESCGSEVRVGAGSCPECGAVFKAVRCPQCGFSGTAAEFSRGCPACGYGKRPAADTAVEASAPTPPRPRGPSLPAVFYRVAIVGLVVLIAALLIVLIWRA
jgi:hypothetical protein